MIYALQSIILFLVVPALLGWWLSKLQETKQQTETQRGEK